MKKLFATLLLLVFVSVGFPATSGKSAGAVYNPKEAPICHDAAGKWNPQNKNCDPNSCGCLFHQIEEFLKGLFG
ncbi:MAG: hypothetical protein IPM63_11325 [Acidobacteriota bacterium]|nr:MAG: hypothetical protein IPM63_11325 [Acidobacteriota bacterium]